MAGLNTLRFPRRPPASRLVVVFRGAPSLAQRLLPGGARPATLQGHALLFLCHTRFGKGQRWLPDRIGSGSDHLSYHLAVEGEGADRSSWTLDQATSSWFEARWRQRKQPGTFHRSTFELKEGPFELELFVRREGHEELYLRGEPTASTPSRVFRNARAAEAFLRATAALPRALFLDDDEDDVAPEPLLLHELRAGLLDDSPFASFELDCAFRFVTRRLQSVRQPATARLRSVIEPQAGTSPIQPA